MYGGFGKKKFITLDDLRWTDTYGYDQDQAIKGGSTWPKEEDLEKINESDLPNLRIKQIKWRKVGSLLSMRYFFNDG